MTVSEDGTVTYSYGGWVWTVADSVDTEEADDDSSIATGKVININTYLNLRSGAGTDYSVIGKLTNGTEVEIIGEENGWYQVVVPEQTGYVYGDYLEVLESAAEDEDMEGLDEFFMLMLLSLLMQGDEDTDTSLALTPDGNLSLIDDIDTATEEDARKQFITVETKSGNYFYIIIDRDDEGEETVYFLNQVDESDLLSLMDEEEVEEYEAAQSADGENNEEAEAATADENETETEIVETAETETNNFNLLLIVLLIVVLAAGGGFFAYAKLKGKKAEEAKPDPDADYEYEDDGEDGYELPDAYADDSDTDYPDEDDSSFEDDERYKPARTGLCLGQPPGCPT
ncbi:MAG: DUF4366 domain-containing protein [Lachnospiraceae bacterium]|nr:DUF4366 domain-containing protein [Lachnospiraceae bacterium]